MKKLLLGLTLIILIISGLSACASAPSEQKEEASTVAPESWQIGENWRYSPQSIWGDTFVATDGKNLIADDLKTKEKRSLKEITTDSFVGEPSIYGDKIVWASANYSEEFKFSKDKDFEALDWNIFLLDLKTGEERQITTDEHAQISPRIYDNIIVWLDNRNEAINKYPHHYDVYAYDLTTGKERRITTTNSITTKDLSISRNMVVWTDSRNDTPSSRIDTFPPVENEDIYLYDLTLNLERQITTNHGADFSPVIDNGHIVWIHSQKVPQADIFMYNVNTGEESQVSKSGYAARAYSPAIYGSRIIWADARISQGNTAGDVILNGMSGAAELYLYNIDTKEESLLVPSESTEFSTNEKDPRSKKFINRQVWLNPVMHDNYVVYTLEGQISSLVYARELKSTFLLILEFSNQKTTLAGAAKAIGRTVPAPSWLPEGYEIKEIYLEPMKDTIPAVMLLISDIPVEKQLVTQTDAAGTRQRYEFRSRMYIYIRWIENGFVVTPHKDPHLIRLMTLNSSTPYLSGDDDSISLWWTVKPKANSTGLFELVLTANKDISEEELIKIAESVTMR